MNSRVVSVLFFLMLVAPVTTNAGSRLGAQALSLVQQNADGWTFEYRQQPMRSVTLELEGKPHLLFTGEGIPGASREGQPQLPTLATSLGIPIGDSVAIEMIGAKYATLENQLVAPVPEYRYTEEGEAIPVYNKDRVAYAADALFPLTVLTVDAPFTLRQQRIVTLRLSPYQYNPASRTLRHLVSGTVKVRRVPARNAPDLIKISTGAYPDPYFEDVYRSLLSNYAQAKEWRISFRPRPDKAGDPTRDWFEIGRTYYKIPVAEDRWYRVTKGDLAAAGASLFEIDTASVRLYSHGIEVPCLLRPDSSIEFYGLMNHGDSSYFDYWTDTNAYWLTWGGEPGLRYSTSPPVAGNPTADLGSAAVTTHFEKNTAFYRGASEEEINEVGPVPGKGWIWDFYIPNQTRSYPFILDTIDAVTGPQSTIRVWLYGTTSSPSAPVSHKAEFRINDSLVGEISFGQRQGALFNASFPTTWLRSGQNTLAIKSVDTGTFPNGFYLDWFEVDVQRFLLAVNNQLLFTSPAFSESTCVRFNVVGFSKSDIDVLSLIDGRRLSGGVIGGDSLLGYSISFQDTVRSPKTYVVVSASDQMRTLPPVKKEFTNIRANPEGADYVIITHRDFLSAAQTLAAHRRSFNGARVAVVTTDEIYDEFNYGVFKGESLKSYLRFAYDNWTAPAPSSVLLFGDAAYDDHHYFTNTTKRNYVPSYGVPTSDNWFGCFDSVNQYLPALLIGRFSVEDSIQAERAVSKITDYDSYALGEWNKNYLFVTGGDTPSEQYQFDAMSEALISDWVTPAPLGAQAFRVFKATPDLVDSRYKPVMKDLIKRGVVFLNYIGHASGKIWATDIGDPNDLENTTGKLPFVSSVSCNIGGFGDQSINTGAEDWTRADHKGAIALWGAVALGYASIGYALVDFFLNSLTIDSVRSFGALTTGARYHLWQSSGNSSEVRGAVQLTPLLGDPLSTFAVPKLPDLSTSASDLLVGGSTLKVGEYPFDLSLIVHNYGLASPDSISISVDDLYMGERNTVLSNAKIGPLRLRDSIVVAWNANAQPGRHTLEVLLDPLNAILEVTKANNAVSVDQYVYLNSLAGIKPLKDQVVSPGAQTLVVSSPLEMDSSTVQYYFELDTSATFSTPALVSSPPVTGDPAAASWSTPSLPSGQLYFWRSRTKTAQSDGEWVTSSFSTAEDAPSPPQVRLRQYSPKQFVRESLNHCTVNDSGVVLAPNPQVDIYCRSLGNRSDIAQEYYSTITVNDRSGYGYWWVWGESFLAARVSRADGFTEFRGFDVKGQYAQSDSLITFIRNTPVGDYIAIVVILDGQTGVTETLFGELESLGSTLARQILPGQSWSLIARRGYPSSALESLTNDSALVHFLLPTEFSDLPGSYTTGGIPVASSWDSLRWQWEGDPAKTSIRMDVFGARPSGNSDTLMVFPADSTAVSLRFLDPLTSGPTYSSLKLGATLLTSDSSVTPALAEWSLAFTAVPDLAISGRTVGIPDQTVQQGGTLQLPVQIYNLGYAPVDSARVVVSVYDKYNKARPIAFSQVGAIPVDGDATALVPIDTRNFPRRATLQIAVSPPKQGKDLVADNNVAYYTFNVVGSQASAIELFVDGMRVMDGDYVPTTPKILVRVPIPDEEHITLRRFEMLVDGKPIEHPSIGQQSPSSSLPVSAAEEYEFAPVLSNGLHEITARVAQANSFGDIDTLTRSLSVQVLSQSRIMQMYNYPNPFATETYFTFVLTGEAPPEELSIRIFTIAGRKIKEIIVPRSELQIGFNRVHWDGRDADGDELANGYYLYQATMKAGGKTETRIEKLAKIR
jgi:hypothetical protein